MKQVMSKFALVGALLATACGQSNTSSVAGHREPRVDRDDVKKFALVQFKASEELAGLEDTLEESLFNRFQIHVSDARFSDNVEITDRSIASDEELYYVSVTRTYKMDGDKIARIIAKTRIDVDIDSLELDLDREFRGYADVIK
ncbi:MAG: hypothetical protein AB7T49_11915 [Oligoflexales bacterium]